MQASAVAVREAATVMLVRDALVRDPLVTDVPVTDLPVTVSPDLEVLMLRRSPHVSFVPGAHVFPGGQVDPSDGDGEARFSVAAARESFEEACVRLDPDALVPFARWVTPRGANKRFDTWFFVALAPEGAVCTHDGVEAVASEWVRPHVVLDRAGRGEVELVYPTYRSLLALRRFPTARTLMDAARARWRRPLPMRRVDADEGWQLDLLSERELRDDEAAASHVARVGVARCPT